MKKLMIGKGGNDSLSIEHKDEIQGFFHKSMELLISSIINLKYVEKTYI
jgi:hypothetical protein